MKMVKKVLFGLAAVAAVMAMTSCGGLGAGGGVNLSKYYKDKQGKIAYYAQIAANQSLSGSWYVPTTTYYAGDDTEGAIKGSNTKYSVEYANETDTAYRAYKETAMKHVGALIKVTFNDALVGTSKMGVIFDLKDDDENSGAKEFYIIGVNPNAENANFYVSKYSNVTDIQANNFGTDSGANEVEIVPLNKANNISVPKAAADGSISFYIYYKLTTDGNFDYAVLDMTDDDMKDFKGNTKFNEANINDYTVLAKGNTNISEYEAAESADDEEED